MKIVVLAGGLNMERDVSLSTGNMIYKTLRDNGHQCILLDVYLGWEGSLDGIFERDFELSASDAAIKETEPDLEAIKRLRKNLSGSFLGPAVLELCQMADVVFLALHGDNGEDGKIQACFELLGIRYTGTDYLSSAIALDKGLAKQILRQNSIPTVRGYQLRSKEEDAREYELRYPKIVKMNTGGSSVGVYLAHNKPEYEAAKRMAFTYDQELVIEEFIEGREFDVGILDGHAMPVIEIATSDGLYDYRNKYQQGIATETCPANLPAEKTYELQRLAEAVFHALKMRGYARMDFRMDDNGSFYCLEANSLPGMTPTSLFPQEAAAMGMSFSQLCEEIIRLALQ
ncbi:MAG: D-alanine--D-alanine ligase [Clostridium sp.]|jgi:D-alanine-D-alanine ligase|nr:D-alanine--D-alanine ligase [Clostridium sp.]